MLNTKLQPGDFRFHCDLTVRFRDCDNMGHVNNAVYSTYLEQARFAYFENLGLDFKKPGAIAFMLVETHIRFLAPAKFTDKLWVYIRAEEIKKSRFNFSYLVFKQETNQAMAVAETVQVGLNMSQQKIASLDTNMVNLVKNFEDI